jgi:hypothetical protein
MRIRPSPESEYVVVAFPWFRLVDAFAQCGMFLSILNTKT